MGHRTPHSGHVVYLVDAQASGSVHVGEIDEHKAALRSALAARDAIIFCNFSRTKENFGAGEGIRTLDPDLGKVSAELFPVVTPNYCSLKTID